MKKMGQEQMDEAELCNPFLKDDGSEITGPEEWNRKKRQYLQFLQENVYGSMPEYNGHITAEITDSSVCCQGRAIREDIALKLFADNRYEIKISILRPVSRDRVPVIIWNCCRSLEVCPIEEELICERKFALVFYDRETIARDSEQDGILEKVYPGYGWGRIAQWTWGISRILDYLDTTEYAWKNHYVVTGHSRGGKVSMCAGIFEERIALCHANDSGCGGAGSLQFMGSRFGLDIGMCETLSGVYHQLPYWWGKNMGQFADGDGLPFDAHILRALIAPRAVLTTEASGDTWSNPYGTLVAWRAAQEVFAYLGCPENNAIQYREGGHGFLESDWRALIDYFDIRFREWSGDHTIVYFEKGWEIGKDPFDWRNIRLHYKWQQPCE